MEKLLALAVLSLVLGGCSAIQTASEHKTLAVNSTEDPSVALSPFATEEKSLYLTVQNSTDANINVAPLLTQKLSAKGYTVVASPKLANQILTVKITSLTRTVNGPSTGAKVADAATAGVAGAAVGTVAAESTFNSNPFNWNDDKNAANGIWIGALAGAVGTAIVDSMVHDVTFTVQTHVQILTLSSSQSTKTNTTDTPSASSGPAVLPQNMVNITTTTSINNNGMSYTLTQVWQNTQTNLTTTADQVNLNIQDATPSIAESIASSIANMF